MSKPIKIVPPTEICNPNYDMLLKKFYSINSNNKKAFEELKIEAKSKVLTEHQMSAILARCDNSINGTYGSTSRQLDSGYYSKKKD
jgi:hypothetical protein